MYRPLTVSDCYNIHNGTCVHFNNSPRNAIDQDDNIRECICKEEYKGNDYLGNHFISNYSHISYFSNPHSMYLSSFSCKNRRYLPIRSRSSALSSQSLLSAEIFPLHSIEMSKSRMVRSDKIRTLHSSKKC